MAMRACLGGRRGDQAVNKDSGETEGAGHGPHGERTAIAITFEAFDLLVGA